MTKHNPEVDLEDLDFEAVDKEMEVEEATAAEGAVPKVVDDESIDAGDNPVV